MKIPLTQIAVINRQRTEIDTKHVAELAKSIDTVGLLHPIVVRKPRSDEAELTDLPYVLMVGGMRYAAHIFLDRTEIECNFFHMLSPLEAEIAELDENLRRKNISWQDEVNATERIVQLRQKINPAQTVTEIAQDIGLQKSVVYRDSALAEAIRKDPSLAEATSKNAALRLHRHKTDISNRLAQANQSHITQLRERLICSDGIRYAKTWRTHSVQMVFTDLPYAIDYFDVVKGGDNALGKYNDDADECRAFIEQLVPELVRIVRPTGWIVLFMCYEWHGWLQELLIKAGLKPELPAWIWGRPGEGSHGHWPELHAANRYEMIVVANGGKATLAKKPVENLLLYPAVEGRRLHSHQKPHALCKELIERCSVLGETVVDFCMGSGAHLAAAAELGRDFYGCDNNPANFDTALAHVGQYYHGDAAIRALKLEK